MKFGLSLHAKEVIKRRAIKKIWIDHVLKNPSLKMEVREDEWHYYAKIEDAVHRCLKVVINPRKRLVITAYFDRKMRKRGCQ